MSKRIGREGLNWIFDNFKKISPKANLFTVHVLVSSYITFQRIVTHILVLEGNSRIIWPNARKYVELQML